MGAKERGESAFSRLLADSASSIADTLTLFNEPAPCGGKKVEWKEVLTAAEGVAKHATTAGVLWKGTVTKREGMENICSYIEVLQGFLLLSHASTAGAGSTLLSCIERASKQVADSSLSLLRGAVAGISSVAEEVDLPVLVGCVWEACEAVKKTPSSNRVAIGRGLTQVAISVKDVLRELGDFKQKSALQCTSEVVTTAGGLDATERCDTHHDFNHGTEAEAGSADEDQSSEFSNMLSVEEMQVVQSVKDLVSWLLSLLKQLLHIVAGTSKASKDAQTADVDATCLWEKLLQLSKDLGVGVDELGASLYPPQEIETLQETVAEVEGLIEHIQADVCSLIGSMPEDFSLALSASKDAASSLNKILEASSKAT